MKIVFASNNEGKIRELQSLLADFDVNIVTQSSLGVSEVPETGLTFVENAFIKARNACLHTRLPAMADDSGLVVDALQSAPGIHSARYAGEKAEASDNIKKLLVEMKNIPEQQRQAAFHCFLVFMTHAEDPLPLICHGKWSGRILEKPQGQQGFGYDPVFWVPGENKSAAELPLNIKNQLSHRGQALRKLMEKLPQKLVALN